MSEPINDKKAKQMLKLIEKGDYNISRPDNMLIEGLINVIGHLNRRIESLDKSLTAHYRNHKEGRLA